MLLEDVIGRELCSQTAFCAFFIALRTCVLASSKGTADAETCREQYVDPNLVISGEVKQQLLNGGIDERLATHFAHLFIRDPLVVYAKDVETFNLKETNHFEGIQSTNWQTVRFKPPPSMNSKNIGWRVEFRPMEVQMTDFENAAFATFIVLLSRAILHFDLNFYVPIKKVDENMEKAHVRDGVLHEKFCFRKDPLSSPHVARSMIGNSSHESTPNETISKEVSSDGTSSGQISFDWSSNRGGSSNSSFVDEPAISENSTKYLPSHGKSQEQPWSVEDEYASMSIDEIVNGRCSSSDGFPGLIPLAKRYLDTTNFTSEARAKVDSYLTLIGSRASGASWTSAKWQRKFIRSHSEYKKDSVGGEGGAYDMLSAVKEITESNGKAEVGREMYNF